jgi:hypothetical protein
MNNRAQSKAKRATGAFGATHAPRVDRYFALLEAGQTIRVRLEVTGSTPVVEIFDGLATARPAFSMRAPGT